MSILTLKRVVVGMLPIVLGTAVATGCQMYPERQDFGDSVRQMRTIQTATPGARTAPQDGQRSRAVLEAYRQDIAKPQEVQNEIVIKVGTGGE